MPSVAWEGRKGVRQRGGRVMRDGGEGRGYEGERGGVRKMESMFVSDQVFSCRSLHRGIDSQALHNSKTRRGELIRPAPSVHAAAGPPPLTLPIYQSLVP